MLKYLYFFSFCRTIFVWRLFFPPRTRIFYSHPGAYMCVCMAVCFCVYSCVLTWQKTLSLLSVFVYVLYKIVALRSSFAMNGVVVGRTQIPAVQTGRLPRTITLYCARCLAFCFVYFIFRFIVRAARGGNPANRVNSKKDANSSFTFIWYNNSGIFAGLYIDSYLLYAPWDANQTVRWHSYGRS